MIISRSHFIPVSYSGHHHGALDHTSSMLTVEHGNRTFIHANGLVHSREIKLLSLLNVNISHDQLGAHIDNSVILKALVSVKKYIVFLSWNERLR